MHNFATCFVPASGHLFCGRRESAFIGRCSQNLRAERVEDRFQTPKRQTVSMGLFGLGFPEIAVIAGIGILVFGPGKIAEMGKDLGGVAGSVKKATSEFQDAMAESLAEADREIERKKQAKSAGAGDEKKPTVTIESSDEAKTS